MGPLVSGYITSIVVYVDDNQTAIKPFTCSSNIEDAGAWENVYIDLMIPLDELNLVDELVDSLRIEIFYADSMSQTSSIVNVNVVW